MHFCPGPMSCPSPVVTRWLGGGSSWGRLLRCTMAMVGWVGQKKHKTHGFHGCENDNTMLWNQHMHTYAIFLINGMVIHPWREDICMYIYICIYIYTYVHIYIQHKHSYFHYCAMNTPHIACLTTMEHIEVVWVRKVAVFRLSADIENVEYDVAKRKALDIGVPYLFDDLVDNQRIWNRNLYCIHWLH